MQSFLHFTKVYTEILNRFVCACRERYDGLDMASDVYYVCVRNFIIIFVMISVANGMYFALNIPMKRKNSLHTNVFFFEIDVDLW